MGVGASVYRAIEWDGSYIHSLPIPYRFPFTLMSVDLGAKFGFIEPDEITMEYIKGRVTMPYEVVKSDPNAEFEKIHRFEVSDLVPQVCAPSSPENTKPISEREELCIGCGMCVAICPKCAISLVTALQHS